MRASARKLGSRGKTMKNVDRETSFIELVFLGCAILYLLLPGA